jgi:cysteine/histidine-rich domain-containing protein 1
MLKVCFVSSKRKKKISKNNKIHLDSCIYHPGGPVFHDALKGWSCCNKKSTDFSTFLSYPGCTKGHHSNIKPVEPEKPKEDQSKIKDVITVQPRRPVEPPTERPSEDEALIDLPISISPSLVNTLENNKPSNSVTLDSDGNQIVPVGTPCKNRGCQTVSKNYFI